jgi:hypothetical protein
MNQEPVFQQTRTLAALESGNELSVNADKDGMTDGELQGKWIFS